ncbi:MAG: 50S ribosomal protein L30e [Methanomicrobiaceae archaeon]|nr:50S ribosomal protein L30e [Methanomicrobiaceae archaeon]
MDFETSLRRAIKSGTVSIGQNSTKACITDGTAQMVVIANNCPNNIIETLNEQANVFAHRYDGSSIQLGKVCGKPFMVSALAIVDAGESDILSLKRA